MNGLAAFGSGIVLLILTVMPIFLGGHLSGAAVAKEMPAPVSCEQQVKQLKRENARLRADIEAIYKAENGG